VHRVFPSSHGFRASSRGFQFHGVHRWDSRKVVTPFMPDSNYLSVGYATLGSLELRPPFTSSLSSCSHILTYTSGTGQASVPILPLSSLQRPVFLLNSRFPLLCALYFYLNKAPFYRRYGGILPSSLSMVLSSAFVYSTCRPVLVYSTVYFPFLFLAIFMGL